MHPFHSQGRELAPGHPRRGLRDSQGQAEPAPSHCQHCACLSCHGAPLCVQARLAFEEAPFGGILDSPAPEACQAGRYQCPSSTRRHWVATPVSSISGFLNSIDLPTQIKLSGIFSGVCGDLSLPRTLQSAPTHSVGRGQGPNCPVGTGALTHHYTRIDIITSPRVIFLT